MAKAAGFTLHWRGKQVIARVERAAILGIEETTEAAVSVAKPDTPVDTGFLRGSEHAVPARREGNRIVGRWGAFGVAYAIWVEIGARGRAGVHMFRRAADREYPKLAGRIRKHFRAMSKKGR